MLKEYPEYKESGIDWIRKIPKYWKTLMLFQCAEEYFKSNKNVHHQNLLSLSYGKIKRKDINTKEGLLPASFDDYQVVKKGNIILRLTDLQNDHKSLRTGLVNETGIITSAYVCIKPRDNVTPEYLHWILHTCDSHKVFYGMGGGVRQSIGYTDISKMYFPIPPVSEQNAIVKYLDFKTKQIDEFVSAKEKEITLLEEFKRSLISDYVSKGNSQTEMKESGIEWIHKIPKHWKILMLFQCAEEYFKSNKDIHHQNLLSLSYGKIKRKDINTKGGLLPESFDNYQVVKKGNVILRLTDLQNDHRSLRTGLVTETGIITSAYVCIKPRENVTPEYLHWILHCCDLHKVFYGMGGGVRQSIGYTDISKMYFPIPPLEEQNVIADYLDKKTYEIDTLISSIQKQITLVKELRTKLIADAVTGKIDVREAV